MSQPYNPDVVVADTDDEEDFAEIQRGTTILKSVSILKVSNFSSLGLQSFKCIIIRNVTLSIQFTVQSNLS